MLETIAIILIILWLAGLILAHHERIGSHPPRHCAGGDHGSRHPGSKASGMTRRCFRLAPPRTDRVSLQEAMR